MFNLLALTLASGADWVWLAVLVVPWAAGSGLLVGAGVVGVGVVARWCWRSATGHQPEPAAGGECDCDQLLAALATATRERDDARYQLAARRTEDETITLPRLDAAA